MYNFNKHIQAQGFDVKVDTAANYGCFEHDEHGEDLGGGLWFEGKNLVDYDGVMVLPEEVVSILLEMGFILDGF